VEFKDQESGASRASGSRLRAGERHLPDRLLDAPLRLPIDGAGSVNLILVPLRTFRTRGMGCLGFKPKGRSDFYEEE
jgi:hypothetical protein